MHLYVSAHPNGTDGSEKGARWVVHLLTMGCDQATMDPMRAATGQDWVTMGKQLEPTGNASRNDRYVIF